MRADLAPVFLSASDLAKRYSVHKITVWKWRAKKRIPDPVRLPSGMVRWRLSDIEAADAQTNAAVYVPRARIKPTSSKKTKTKRVRRSKRDRR